MCCSAVNDGSCSPWVMCSCSVVRGNQIRDTIVKFISIVSLFLCGFIAGAGVPRVD